MTQPGCSPGSGRFALVCARQLEGLLATAEGKAEPRLVVSLQRPLSAAELLTARGTTRTREEQRVRTSKSEVGSEPKAERCPIARHGPAAWQGRSARTEGGYVTTGGTQELLK